MSAKTEYVITAEGQIARRQIAESVVDVTEAMLQSMSSTVTRRFKGVFDLPGHGTVNVVVGDGWNHWTVPMPKLILRAPFRMRNDCLVPAFNSSTDPVLTLDWLPPMRVSMLIAERQVDHKRGNSWLFAGGDLQDLWRLPLANIFEDCKLCLGEQTNPILANSMECLKLTISHFNNARYNADLWSNTEGTFNMFRFKPKNEGFEQQPLLAGTDWRTLCTRIVGDASSNYLYL